MQGGGHSDIPYTFKFPCCHTHTKNEINFTKIFNVLTFLLNHVSFYFSEFWVVPIFHTYLWLYIDNWSFNIENFHWSRISTRMRMALYALAFNRFWKISSQAHLEKNQYPDVWSLSNDFSVVLVKDSYPLVICL